MGSPAGGPEGLWPSPSPTAPDAVPKAERSARGAGGSSLDSPPSYRSERACSHRPVGKERAGLRRSQPSQHRLGIAQILHQAGARLALAYQNERLREPVARLAESLGNTLLVQCDVSDDDQVAQAFDEVREGCGELEAVVHSIAYANRDDLGGDFSKTGREGFRTALEISAYSLVPIVGTRRHSCPRAGAW